MVNLLGFNIYSQSKDQYIKELLEKFRMGKRIVVVSGNPEVLYNAQNNSEIMDVCKESDIIPDGIGVLIAARITGQKFFQKIAGIDVMEDILKQSRKNNMKIYLLGAEGWVVEKAASVCREKYNAEISGFHDGYFNMDKCMEVINNINSSGSSVLLVAMGCPRQEIFISKYKDMLNCRLLMGVGGSFDVLAGKVNRAPDWMIKIGLEWLYRVSKEPWRIKRLTSIPKFILTVLMK